MGNLLIGIIIGGAIGLPAGSIITWLYAKKAIAAAEAKLGQLGSGLGAVAKKL